MSVARFCEVIHVFMDIKCHSIEWGFISGLFRRTVSDRIEWQTYVMKFGRPKVKGKNPTFVFPIYGLIQTGGFVGL